MKTPTAPLVIVNQTTAAGAGTSNIVTEHVARKRISENIADLTTIASAVAATFMRADGNAGRDCKMANYVSKTMTVSVVVATKKLSARLDWLTAKWGVTMILSVKQICAEATLALMAATKMSAKKTQTAGMEVIVMMDGANR